MEILVHDSHGHDPDPLDNFVFSVYGKDIGRCF
jgi:hypothetical protein